jgi:hypothetical protein
MRPATGTWSQIMAVAALDPRSLAQDAPPELDAFLQLFGEVCAVPSVARVGLGQDGAAVGLWIRLSSGDETDEYAVYGAVQRYLANGDVLPIDLTVIFPDEAESAWPKSVRTIFTRA